MSTTLKRLIDVAVGEAIVGIGIVQATSSSKGVTVLVALDLSVPKVKGQPQPEASITYVWKSDQLVDVGVRDE